MNGRCWARAYVWRKWEYPLPWDCRMTTTKSCRFVGGRDATVALPAWIVLAPYRIVDASWAFVSIRSSTVVNRSAVVMSRSGSVDESCRHHRSIVRHRIDAGISFFPSRRIPMQPDFTICLKSGWVVVNRGLNRDSVTGALHVTAVIFILLQKLLYHISKQCRPLSDIFSFTICLVSTLDLHCLSNSFMGAGHYWANWLCSYNVEMYFCLCWRFTHHSTIFQSYRDVSWISGWNQF